MPGIKPIIVIASIRQNFRFWLPALGLAMAAPMAHAQEPDLPRPLLDVGGTRTAAPASAPATASPSASATPTPDPLETIRKLREWRRANPTPVPVEPIATSAPEPLSNQGTPAPTVSPRPTTAPEITAAQVRQWNEEARQLQRAGESARAGAMYRKVWEADPENRFDMSDMAYINWCGLIVSRNDDGLRREAYARILEFQTRFPKSPNLDSAVFIRATLATDLGKVDEAYKLLEDFPRQFPESRRKAMAFRLLTSLPPQPGERRITPTPGATRRSSPDSSSRPESGSSSNSGSSTTPRRTPTPSRSESPAPSRTIRSAYDVPSGSSRATPRSSNPVRSSSGNRP